MYLKGQRQLVVDGRTAVDILPINPLRLMPTMSGCDRLAVFVQIDGQANAAVSVDLTPIVVDRYGAAATPGTYDDRQFENTAKKVTVTGTVGAAGEPVRKYVELEVTDIHQVGVELTAITGTQAKCTAYAQRGQSTPGA